MPQKAFIFIPPWEPDILQLASSCCLNGINMDSFLLEWNKRNSTGVRELLVRCHQCSKWAGICWYTIPLLHFVPEFHTNTYSVYVISIYLFQFFWRYILVSLLNSIPALLNLHFERWIGITLPVYMHHCMKYHIVCMSMSLIIQKKCFK
jgi:hypothetical protein